MSKTEAAGPDSGNDPRRRIPSIDRILSGPAARQTIEEFGRERVKSALDDYLRSFRERSDPFDGEAAMAAVRDELFRMTTATLRRVINGSGIIIHTNLGRSPIEARTWSAAVDVVSGYCNLEFDLEEGERGARDEHLTALCQTLFGCEAALLTNNNAAAILLVLAATAAGREVLVSRGELVEIGGSFRVPEVIEQGGCRLREVGTTNRTRASDFEEAAGRRTAAILRVHRSNFEIVGFSETPEVSELAAVARKKKIPLIYDEGSGRVVDLEKYGFSHGATLRELLAGGVDLLTCSTDKLIGSVQGGLILGSKEWIDRCRRHPLMRALRAGKESYAITAATLRAFATGNEERGIEIYRMLATSIEELRMRGEEMVAGAGASVVDSRCALGGGTTPGETIPSVALHVPGDAERVRARMLAHEPPIVGRILDDRFTIEVRTLGEMDRRDVRKALLEMATPGVSS